MELIGLCKNCLGCNRLEDKNFKGTYRCEYATIEELDINTLKKELSNERKMERYRKLWRTVSN